MKCLVDMGTYVYVYVSYRVVSRPMCQKGTAESRRVSFDLSGCITLDIGTEYC